MKFIAIATAADAENGESLVALGEDGVIYERNRVYYGAGSSYQGRHINRGRALTEEFWSKVELPFAEPPLSAQQLAMLDLAGDEGE